DRHQWGGRLADEYLRRVGIVPRERFELNALNSIAVMVDRGLGVSLVPDWLPPWPEGLRLARLHLPEASETRRIGLGWSNSSVRARAVAALREECLQVCAARWGGAAFSRGSRPGRAGAPALRRRRRCRRRTGVRAAAGWLARSGGRARSAPGCRGTRRCPGPAPRRPRPRRRGSRRAAAPAPPAGSRGGWCPRRAGPAARWPAHSGRACAAGAWGRP